MDIGDRVEAYNSTFRHRPGLLADGGMIVGCWMVGCCYKNRNELYGAYPRGYLERIHAMFPDARSILHAFSGGLNWEVAWDEAGWGDNEGPDMELVDLHGPEDGRFPTWRGDLLDFCQLPENAGRFDLILADPPYSAADAEKYDVPMIDRRKVMHRLRTVCGNGGHLVWLDQVWPQFRKHQWKTIGTIGLVRSTNHRVRLVSIFEATGTK